MDQLTGWWRAIATADVDGDDVLATYDPTNITGLSYRDPRLDLTHGPHPVVAFSHGYISIRFQSFYMMEHLASHGFVVISPDHPTNTLFDLDQTNDVNMMLERPDDVRYSVDHLFSLSKEEGRFKDGLLTDEYAAMGHSFGAVTVMRLGGGVVDWQALDAHCESGKGNGRVCEVLREIDGEVGDHGELDERVRTTVPMSPGIWYAFGENGLGLESLQI